MILYYVELLNHELATRGERIARLRLHLLHYKWLFEGFFLSQEHHVHPLLCGTQSKGLNDLDFQCN